jgi:hypothetical protein
MFVKTNTLPRVGEKVILMGCDGERCESTIVEICKPEAMSMYVVEDGDGTRFWVYDARTCDCGAYVSNEWSRVVGDPAENVIRPAVDTFLVHDDMTVEELAKKLKRFDNGQKFRVQAILPNRVAWNAPARIGEIQGSNCSNGRPYVFLAIRCDGEKE